MTLCCCIRYRLCPLRKKDYAVSRNASRIPGLIFCLLLIISATPLHAAQNADAPDEMKIPDALVWISATDPSVTYISITFPRIIQKARADSYLASILKYTGWSASGIKITSDSASGNGGNPMTAIEFASPQLAAAQDGTLPIEPFIKALRDLKSIQMLVMTYPGFRYAGVGSFENRYVKISLAAGQNSLNFSIDVKDPRFTDLGLPKPNQEGVAATPTRPAPGIAILIVVLAIAVSIAVYFGTKNYMNRNRRSIPPKEK